ncbi:hypothetical protein ACFX13_036354 [Malus domestica]|uniref:Uncharacterized protein n=1 Tax=Malus domestica TaxID=3750 RepID=A0A498JY87_MALDO|nr:hypothetical protein DVH24_010466 [Malus domestica]
MLVVDHTGNSGMEVSLGLPSMVVHVMPREIFRISAFELAVFLLKWLPVWLTDKFLQKFSWLDRLVLGSVKRPSMGLMEMKNIEGKTPVLDIGTNLVYVTCMHLHVSICKRSPRTFILCFVLFIYELICYNLYD